MLNPRASLAEVARYVRGERQEVPCIGGYKYFYLDWNLDIWRCEAWNEPLGSVFDFDRIPHQRDACNACMMGCYRTASMLMHAAVAATDTARALAAGRVGAAVSTLFRRSVAQSLWRSSRKRRICAAWRAGGNKPPRLPCFLATATRIARQTRHRREGSDTVLLYGHLDKQPEMVGRAPLWARLINEELSRGIAMLDRRRILAAAFVAMACTVGSVLAQPPPPFRPPMPPPRHQVRPPRPPGPHRWYWSQGRWRWNGRRWVWISGRWRW